MSDPFFVLGIDPGRAKCGLAVVGSEGVIFRQVCDVLKLVESVLLINSRFDLNQIVVGDATNGRKLCRVLRDVEGLPSIDLVSEEFTSLEARKRYFAEHPPTGLGKLLPTSMRTPPVPIDDYAAAILAERAYRLLSNA